MTEVESTHIVRQILMSKSQLQPVIKPAAAGGKSIATIIRTTSVALTIVDWLRIGILWSMWSLWYEDELWSPAAPLVVT